MNDRYAKRDVLVWVDLETTGLDPLKGRVLEYAVVFTDLELNELGNITCVIPQKVATTRSLMGDYVTNMHTKNGLLAALEKIERELPIPEYVDSVMAASDTIVAELPKYDNGNTRFIVAGSNPLFDIKWMMVHMPSLVDQIDHRTEIDGPESYRCLDASVYKVGFPEMFPSNPDPAHRAMDDIRESIASHAKMRKAVEDAWKYEQLV